MGKTSNWVQTDFWTQNWLQILTFVYSNLTLLIYDLYFSKSWATAEIHLMRCLYFVTEDYIRYACGVIADYLQPDLAKQLREYLGWGYEYYIWHLCFFSSTIWFVNSAAAVLKLEGSDAD